jgi:2-polyprenyl-6-methoxyphenol hydroxylase-like FAD-dependent oxidoreductase
MNLPSKRLDAVSPAYDVIVAGARVAGAATAMLLARAGMRVLMVDPRPPSQDTLSTHALMRGSVQQLHRWGLLPEVLSAGTPPITSTIFDYGEARIEIPIKDRDGVRALCAPRRTTLDPILNRAARRAGVDIV